MKMVNWKKAHQQVAFEGHENGPRRLKGQSKFLLIKIGLNQTEASIPLNEMKKKKSGSGEESEEDFDSLLRTKKITF